MKACSIGLLSILSATTLSAHVHEFSNPPFSIELPDCYVAQSTQEVSGGALATFRPLDGVNDASCPAAAIVLTDLGGTIGREDVGLEHLPPGSQVSSTPWGEFDVQVIRVPVSVAAGDFLELDVQVPLKPAVQVAFVTQPNLEEATMNLLAAAISSIKGDSNWLTDEERASALGEGVGRAVGFVAVLAIGLYLVVRRLRR